MRINDANSRWRAPRLLGIAALAVGLIVLAAVGAGGAGAAPGDADLSITKTASPNPVVQGNNVTYLITVTNHGPMNATNVDITDTLPATSNADFVSATSSEGACQKSGNTVTCPIGNLANGSNATATIVLKAKKVGTLSNTAAVTSPEDNTPANNSATATVSVVKKAAAGKKPKGALSCGAPTIAGTPGNDVITGTARKDAIATYGGNDVVFGGGGGDLICTGSGADRAFGQDGNDTIIAGPGRDLANGGKGGDILKGKAGRDRLKGKSGNDFLNGGSGRDRCKGGSGADTLRRCP